MLELISSQHLTALFQVIMIDLVLAGDNAIVIALAARALPAQLRKRAIVWGTVGAIAVRSLMTVVVVWLLKIPGLLLMGGALLTLWCGQGWRRVLAAAVLVLPWLGALGLQRIEWTRGSGAPVTVAIVQGAIPQDLKWIERNREPTRVLYRQLNDQALGAQLVLWPESAVPELANEMVDFLRDIYARSERAGSDVVMGAMRVADNGQDYYNSMMALTAPLSFYDKRHLVPFGEYFPVPDRVRSWLRLLSLPYADFTAGTDRQPALQAGGLKLAPTICYEDAFGSAQLAVLREAEVLASEKIGKEVWFWVNGPYLEAVLGNVLDYVRENA